MMKTLIAAVLAAVCIASMTACSRRSDENSSSSAPSTVSSAPSSMASSAPAPSSSHASSRDSLVSDMESGLESGADSVTSAVESAVTPTMSADFDKIGALGSAQVKWGSGLHRDPETNRTTDTEALQEKYGSLGAYFIAPADCGKFYLTFDEGYENGYTPQILDILKEKDAKAVFFVTMPYVKSAPELVQRMIDEGHIVGNHTNHHWNPTEKTLEQAQQDIQELHDYMLETFNYTMHLYRPPQGAFSEQTLSMAQQMGYTTVLWSFGYSDWDPKNQPEISYGRKVTQEFIHEGAIYLLHAVSATDTAVLPELIDEVRARGLTIAPFDLPYTGPGGASAGTASSSQDA